MESYLFRPTFWEQKKYNGNGSFANSSIFITCVVPLQNEVNTITMDGVFKVRTYKRTSTSQSWTITETTDQVYTSAWLVNAKNVDRKSNIHLGDGVSIDVTQYPDVVKMIFEVNFINTTMFNLHPPDWTPPDDATGEFYALSEELPTFRYDAFVWYMGANGFPTNENIRDEAEYTEPIPLSQWTIKEGYNDGFPFNMLIPDIPYVPQDLWILPQRPLIHVYGEKTTNFNTNGYAIIEPISCEVYHEENGEYSAQFETYCDEYGKFTYLHKQAQVKIPIRYHGEVSWQIFRVMNTHRIMNADGTYRIRALAYHKFYDNNNFLIKSAHPTGMSGITALPYICTHSLYNSQIYPFEASSDITAGKTAYYDNMSITNALLGSDQCFVNRWGGKLYRDNLYFSINDEMEYSKSAGVISYAYNLTDIDFEEDDTELITDLIAEDNFGNSYHIGVPDSELRVPNRIYAYRSFYYDEEDVQAFHADAAAYLDEYKQSVVNITVNFLNLSELDKYKEFQQLDAYEVGDRVIIYHKDLDIYYSHLEIISKRYDVVKRRTVEIQIGDFKNAITQRAYMSDTISDGQTAQDKMNAQLFAQDTKIMSVSISGMETFDIFALEKRTINELEGR